MAMRKQRSTRSNSNRPKRVKRAGTKRSRDATARRGINARYPWKEEPNPYFELRTSAIQGTGAFATRTIKKGTRIIEYLGQRISWRTADKRYDDEKMNRHHTFLFTVDDKTCIDAAVNGNDARFINHSCRPNCYVDIKDGVIWIRASRTIRRGEELSYHYNTDGEGLIKCRCRAGCQSLL